MKDATRALLDKAAENLAACRDLIADGHFEVAVSRAYYAMFYAAEAALLEEDLEFSSHGAVHGAFGERLVKAGRLDPELHRHLLDGFRARQSADYEAPADVSEQDARILVERTAEFLGAVTRFLEP